MNIYYLKYWGRFRWNIYKKKIIHDFDQPVTKTDNKKKRTRNRYRHSSHGHILTCPTKLFLHFSMRSRC